MSVTALLVGSSRAVSVVTDLVSMVVPPPPPLILTAFLEDPALSIGRLLFRFEVGVPAARDAFFPEVVVALALMAGDEGVEDRLLLFAAEVVGHGCSSLLLLLWFEEVVFVGSSLLSAAAAEVVGKRAAAS